MKKKGNNNRQTKSKKECSVADVMDFLNTKKSTLGEEKLKKPNIGGPCVEGILCSL